MNKTMLSWGQRFALIEHYKPSDEKICNAFGVTQAELDVSRMLRAAKSIPAAKPFDMTQYATLFDTTATQSMASAGYVKTGRSGGSTSHLKPESFSPPVRVPQKRGRKGDKISKALSAVPSQPVPVEQFMAEHGVSLAVLRQAKRFMAKMDPEDVKKIGTVHVRQDKNTRALMIWRTDGE